jgi:DNA-binding NtrC family response regulator|uniref:Response regulator n=1 Tax=Desulfobacca acetoxidans TaxID=60893 RepID=A0A7C3SJG8_9BACT
MEIQKRIIHGRILVVDRDEWCREFLSQVIKLVGFEEFRLADTVEEAMAALQESPFDLVITDFKLPDYHVLLENCRQRSPSTRFILMIHQRNQSQQINYMERMDIVVKPLSLDEMARKIQDALLQRHRWEMEEKLRRLKKEAFRLWT